MGRLMAKKTVIILLKLSEEGSIIGRKKKISSRWGSKKLVGDTQQYLTQVSL